MGKLLLTSLLILEKQKRPSFAPPFCRFHHRPCRLLFQNQHQQEPAWMTLTLRSRVTATRTVTGLAKSRPNVAKRSPATNVFPSGVLKPVMRVKYKLKTVKRKSYRN